MTKTQKIEALTLAAKIAEADEAACDEAELWESAETARQAARWSRDMIEEVAEHGGPTMPDEIGREVKRPAFCEGASVGFNCILGAGQGDDGVGHHFSCPRAPKNAAAQPVPSGDLPERWLDVIQSYEATGAPSPSELHLAAYGHRNARVIVQSVLDGLRSTGCACGAETPCEGVDVTRTPAETNLAAALDRLLEVLP